MGLRDVLKGIPDKELREFYNVLGEAENRFRGQEETGDISPEDEATLSNIIEARMAVRAVARDRILEGGAELHTFLQGERELQPRPQREERYRNGWMTPPRLRR